MDIFKFKKALSLLELIVVITIIGILATVALASYGTVQKKARDTKRKDDLKQIRSALILYYQDFKQYPPSCSPCSDVYVSSTASSEWINGLGTYMAGGNIPRDPLQQASVGDCENTPNSYCYYVTSKRDSFILIAQLENTNDPNVNPSCVNDINPPPIFSSPPTSYNHCVKSPAL